MPDSLKSSADGWNLSNFRPTPESLLGKGVWGEVYDLGDGTVLKLARVTGGLGDGCAKLRKEADLGRLFQGQLSFAVPRCLEAGEFEVETPEGFGAWMRSTRIGGRVGTVTDSQLAWGNPLGSALRELHLFLEAPQFRQLALPDPILTELTEDQGLSADDAALARKVEQLYSKVPKDRWRPIHGDFNISNVMLDGCSVCGVLDFAEFCLGYLEEDVVSLTAELPELASLIAQGYARPLDPVLLQLASAKRALIGMILCRYRLADLSEAIKNEEVLRATLGGPIIAFVVVDQSAPVQGRSLDPDKFNLDCGFHGGAEIT